MIIPNKNKAIFLDRDGTLNIDTGYLYQKEKWQWIVGVQESLSLLSQAGYKLIVITNQSGISRGYYNENDLNTLHAWVNKDLSCYGVQIDAFYHCPHHPEFTGECQCRKPSPYLILKAAEEHNIDLQQSWMIGDKLSDIKAGNAAGCKTILIDNTLNSLINDTLVCVACNLFTSIPIILGKHCINI